MTNTQTQQYQAKLVEVLKPTPAEKFRYVPAIEPPAGSVLDKVVTHAARQIRDLYVAGRRHVSYDEAQPEFFQDACADTWFTAAEMQQSVADDVELSIVEAIFHRAGWLEFLRPTTLRSQVEMQLVAAEAARKARSFVAWQDKLAF